MSVFHMNLSLSNPTCLFQANIAVLKYSICLNVLLIFKGSILITIILNSVNNCPHKIGFYLSVCLQKINGADLAVWMFGNFPSGSVL